MQRLVVDISLLRFLAARKKEDEKKDPPLIVVEMIGMQLPPDFRGIPTEPPVDVNFGELDRLAERRRKMLDELDELDTRQRKAWRALRNTIQSARQSDRALRVVERAAT